MSPHQAPHHHGRVPSSRFQRELPLVQWPRSVSELEAAGVAEHELRTGRWRRTSRGFYRPATGSAAGPDGRTCTTTQRIADASALVPPGGAIGGWAAAFVMGVDTLDGWRPGRSTYQPVLVITPRDLGRRPSDLVRYCRSELAPQDVVHVGRLTLSSPVRTVADGARACSSLADAVVLVDACLHHRLVDREALRRHLDERPGWAGIRRARRALDLSSPASRSAWETRLRLIWTLDAQLPDVMVNQPIFDESGDLLGIADLLEPESATVAEFDGQQHRDRDAHRADNVREERLESAGLTVVRADSLDVSYHRSELVRRLTDAYERGMRRNRAHDRWTLAEPAWWLAQVASV